MCRISKFYFSLFFATSWLLVAISMERARAIFKPFANRLSARFVILMSAIILVGAGALNLKFVLSYKYHTNILVYHKGSVY